MPQRIRNDAVTWAQNASLSSFVWFGAEAPGALDLPATMDGNRVALVRARTGADGNVDVATAEDVFDIAGNKVTIPVTAGVVVFDGSLLRGLGWIGLRSELSNGTAQVQSVARSATWLGVTDL